MPDAAAFSRMNWRTSVPTTFGNTVFSAARTRNSPHFRHWIHND